MMKNKILITGGHISPAVAVIQELGKRGNVDIHFVGRRYAFSEAKEKISYEYETIRDLSIPFSTIEPPRFPMGLQLFLFPFTLLPSFIKALSILQKVKPSVVVSFGGYIAGPVVLAASLLSIPIVMHEQTVRPGRANKLFSRLAKRMCISWDESRNFFPQSVQKKLLVTGNPVREEIRKLREKKSEKKSHKTIYITGGSSGAHRINAVVQEALPELVTAYHVIHQCGDSQFYDFEKLSEVRETLTPKSQKNYELHKYIDLTEIISVLTRADIIVGRSGANTIVELALIGKPAILIPLPESAFNEQYKQAELLESHGSATIIDQKELTKERLLKEITSIFTNLKKFQTNAEQYAKTDTITLHNMAHTRIVDCIIDCISDRDHLVSTSK